jgi:hypothetical protein
MDSNSTFSCDGSSMESPIYAVFLLHDFLPCSCDRVEDLSYSCYVSTLALESAKVKHFDFLWQRLSDFICRRVQFYSSHV